MNLLCQYLRQVHDKWVHEYREICGSSGAAAGRGRLSNNSVPGNARRKVNGDLLTQMNIYCLTSIASGSE